MSASCHLILLDLCFSAVMMVLICSTASSSFPSLLTTTAQHKTAMTHQGKSVAKISAQEYAHQNFAAGLTPILLAMLCTFRKLSVVQKILQRLKYSLDKAESIKRV